MEIAKKGGFGLFADLRGGLGLFADLKGVGRRVGLGKKEGGCF